MGWRAGQSHCRHQWGEVVNMTGHSSILGGARRWDFLASLLGPKGRFIELGCKEGRTTGHILKTCPEATVVAIDPWSVQPQNDGVENGETYEKWDFAAIEAEFWKNVGEHKDRCLMLRKTSADATYCDVPADLIFIDAAHDYQNVRDDISRWWPIVKDGGILAGHDYNHSWPTVERAVADSFPLMEVGVGPDSVWFVLKRQGLTPHG